MNQQPSVFSPDKSPILIVDDDRDTCELINYFLSPDFDCDMAFDGEQALQRVMQKDYSVILVDLMLPKIDGYALIRSVAEKSPATPVIVVSAVAEVDAAIKAMNDGGVCLYRKTVLSRTGGNQREARFQSSSLYQQRASA